MTYVAAGKQNATVHRPPTTSVPTACRTINLVPTCAPICVSCYLSVPSSLLSEASRPRGPPKAFVPLALTSAPWFHQSGSRHSLALVMSLASKTVWKRWKGCSSGYVSHESVIITPSEPDLPSPSCVQSSISLSISDHPSSGIHGSRIHNRRPRRQVLLSRKRVAQPV